MVKMAEWVHCNTCLAKPTQNLGFSVTKCGHLFCNRCIDGMKENNKCALCKDELSAIPLGKDTNAEVLEYFTPLEEINKKMMLIYQFKEQQRKVVVQNIGQKYNQRTKDFKHVCDLNKKLQNEIKTLTRMLNEAVGRGSPLASSTPNSASTGPIPRPGQVRTPLYPGFAHRVTSTQNIHGSGSTPGSSLSSFQKVPRYEIPTKSFHGSGSTPRSSLSSLHNVPRHQPSVHSVQMSHNPSPIYSSQRMTKFSLHDIRNNGRFK